MRTLVLLSYHAVGYALIAGSSKKTIGHIYIFSIFNEICPQNANMAARRREAN
jgi:hypothetical protein